MMLARVVGTVVATQKHRKFEGAKLLLVQPLTLEDAPRGPCCCSRSSRGVNEKVLVVIRRTRAAEAVGRKERRRCCHLGALTMLMWTIVESVSRRAILMN